MLCSAFHPAAQASSNTGKSSPPADHGSPLRSTNDDGTCYDAFALMCTGEENNFGSNCVKDDEGDGCDISEVEDLEVVMDFTDDLLLMVYSVKRIIFVLFVYLSTDLGF